MSVSVVYKSVDSLLMFLEIVTSKKLILLNDFSIVNFMAGGNKFKYSKNSFNRRNTATSSLPHVVKNHLPIVVSFAPWLLRSRF